jgi:hypothetical protein
MSKYFTHQEGNQLGPFSIDELKELKITKDTQVWKDGMDDWQKASTIEELKLILTTVPPPINSKAIPPPIKEFKSKLSEPLIAKPQERKSKVVYYLSGAIIVILFFGFLAFSNYQSNQENMERVLQEQNTKIQEQERIEAERLAADQKVKREEELSQLKYELNLAQVELELANEGLVKAKEFKFLRTPQEKENEIASAVFRIKAAEEAISELKKNISKYQ